MERFYVQIGANGVNERTKFSTLFKVQGDGSLIVFLTLAVFVLPLQEQTVL
jgi:hypothetical protein